MDMLLGAFAGTYNHYVQRAGAVRCRNREANAVVLKKSGDP